MNIAESKAKKIPLFPSAFMILLWIGLVASLLLAWLGLDRSLPDNLRFMGRLHPMFLHLPIGVLIALFLMEFLYLLQELLSTFHQKYI